MTPTPPVSDASGVAADAAEWAASLPLLEALDGMGVGLWDWNLSTDEVRCSPRFQALLGYWPEATFGSVFSFRGHLHPDDLLRVTRLVRTHFDGESPGFDAEYRLRRRDGAYRWFHGRGVVARNAHGQPARFAGLITDITPRVEAAAERDALQAQLGQAQKLEALGTLAAGVALDFQRVLQTAQGHLQALHAQLPPNAEGANRLSEAERALGQATALAQQMLAFSRQQARHMAVIDLGAWVGELVDGLRPALPAGVVLRHQGPPEPLRVLADADQLRQAVLNVCDNAIHAVAARGGEVLVAVSAEADPVGARLVVKDSGEGMPPPVLARVFEPFFTTRPPGEGAGLGLTAAQVIVKAHQGRVKVHSAPGSGTWVEIGLPVIANPPNPPGVALAARPAPAPVAAGPASGAAPAAGGRHVVYIDDYEAMVYLITRMLKKRGYRVTAFERADDALAFMRAHSQDIDLLVTDYNMPGISGLDVLREVKAWRADLPVVITSGHVTPGMTAEAKAEGVIQVLNKQDSVDDLAQTLADVLAALPDRARAAGEAPGTRPSAPQSR